jgi:hypothetical protein
MENEPKCPESENEQQERVHTTETLSVTRTTITNAFVEPTTHADLVSMLEAPKAPPLSPTLKDETTLKTFLPKRYLMFIKDYETLTRLLDLIGT